MGYSAKRMNPLLYSPRNVWDDKGKLIGTYFPTTKAIRLMGGDLLQVDSSDNVRRPDGEVAVLDRHTFVLKIGN
jgi:hypothetical protein